MKKSLKYIGFVVLGLVVLFFFLNNFSAAESSFQCSGEASLGGTTRPMSVFIKLTEYRPWVRSDSHGSMNLEIPNEWFEYYGYIEETGDQLQIYETYPQKAFKGSFSKLSKTLTIDIESPFGFFNGTCVAS